MIEGRAGIIRQMAKEAYQLSIEQIQEKANTFEKWPAHRNAKRLVPIQETTVTLKSLELSELVYMGFILMIEATDGKWYPVRTFDFMTGTNTDLQVEIAKNDVLLARALKGSDPRLDIMM